MENDRTLCDHEERIRSLEKINYEQQIQMKSIENGLNEIKLMQQTTTTKILDMLSDNQTNTSKINLIDRKELWAVVSLLVGGIIAYLKLK